MLILDWQPPSLKFTRIEMPPSEEEPMVLYKKALLVEISTYAQRDILAK